jgi:hypothetical protein
MVLIWRHRELCSGTEEDVEVILFSLAMECFHVMLLRDMEDSKAS